MGKKVKTGRVFDGKRYQRKSQHVKKSKADETAQMYRNRGALARVVPEKTKRGTLWVVYKYG